MGLQKVWQLSALSAALPQLVGHIVGDVARPSLVGVERLGWFNVRTAYRDAAPSSSRMGAVSISIQEFLADVVMQGKPSEAFHIRPSTTLGIGLLKHGSRIPAQSPGFRPREQNFTVYEHLHSDEDIGFSHVTGSPFTFRDNPYAAALCLNDA
jgi:hypothetical protein